MSQTIVRLSACEDAVWDELRRKLVMAGRDWFNADDLSDWKLDEKLYGADTAEGRNVLFEVAAVGFCYGGEQGFGQI